MGIGQQLLQLPVLNLEPLQLPGLRYLHPAVLGPPSIEGVLRDPVLPANLLLLCPSLGLLQDFDDLFFSESSVNRFRFMVSSPPSFYRKTHSRSGPFFGGEVTRVIGIDFAVVLSGQRRLHLPSLAVTCYPRASPRVPSDALIAALFYPRSLACKAHPITRAKQGGTASPTCCCRSLSGPINSCLSGKD